MATEDTSQEPAADAEESEQAAKERAWREWLARIPEEIEEIRSRLAEQG